MTTADAAVTALLAAVDRLPADGRPVRAQHLTELRQAAAAVRAHQAGPASSGWLQLTAAELAEPHLGRIVRFQLAHTPATPPSRRAASGQLVGVSAWGGGPVAVRLRDLGQPAPGGRVHVLAAGTVVEVW